MKKAKVHKTLRLSEEVVKYFEKKSQKSGISVNALINAALLEYLKASKS